ncbi:MAG: hypothetical protein R3Y19_00410 [Rikenellaceae bacterium]
MDKKSFEQVELLILREVVELGSVLLPDICVLSIAHHQASIAPDAQTILPPRKTLEVYHPQDATAHNIIESIADSFVEISFQEAANLYWAYMNQAIADGTILTIASVGVINMATLEVVVLSGALSAQLTPENAPIIIPIFEEQKPEKEKAKLQRKPINRPSTRPVNPSKVKADNGASSAVIWICSVIIFAAAAYLCYFFVN